MSAAALQIPGVWRASEAPLAGAVVSTRSAALDQALGGGWPQGALTQIVSGAPGLGFSLLLPALAALTAAGRPVALIDPPYLPYAPALAERGVVLEQLFWLQVTEPAEALWAAEQVLRSGLFGALVYWGGPLAGSRERRLQLAADDAQCLAFCFHAGAVEGHSHAALRLAVTARADAQLQVTVLKRRGGRHGHSLLHRSADAPADRRAA